MAFKVNTSCDVNQSSCQNAFIHEYFSCSLFEILLWCCPFIFEDSYTKIFVAQTRILWARGRQGKTNPTELLVLMQHDLCSCSLEFADVYFDILFNFEILFMVTFVLKLYGWAYCRSVLKLHFCFVYLNMHNIK